MAEKKKKRPAITSYVKGRKFDGPLPPDMVPKGREAKAATAPPDKPKGSEKTTDGKTAQP
jgi:hypothetical protein